MRREKNIRRKEVFSERLEEEQGPGEGEGEGEGCAEQVKVSADQEEELGGHKDSFVSLAVALASTKKGKKTSEARGWMDDGLEAWRDVSHISVCHCGFMPLHRKCVHAITHRREPKCVWHVPDQVLH